MAQSRQANNEPPPMRRRLKNAALILISQLLLFALAVAWLIHMSLIAAYGSINFIEDNPFILWGEISISAAIMIFAIFVLVNQIKRLGERRSADRDRGSRGPSTAAETGFSRRRTDDRKMSLQNSTETSTETLTSEISSDLKTSQPDERS